MEIVNKYMERVKSVLVSNNTLSHADLFNPELVDWSLYMVVY